jgi:3'-phosphoadenosine 5'-phosphosulfate sulfotransferase
MKLKKYKLLKENKNYILENVKQGKMYVSQGKLSEEDLKTLIQISPDPKYVGWLAKIWMNEKPDIDDLRNTIEEYDTFLKKGKAKTKDINQFKSINQVKVYLLKILKKTMTLS